MLMRDDRAQIAAPRESEMPISNVSILLGAAGATL